jgi:hypothetical protein
LKTLRSNATCTATPWSDGRAASFFYSDVLGQSAADAAAAAGETGGGGMEPLAPPLAAGLGPCKWWLVLGLALNWLVCYACIYNGGALHVESS